MSSKFEKVRRMLFSDVLSKGNLVPVHRIGNALGRVMATTMNIVTAFTFIGFLYLLAERYVWKDEVWALATMAGHRWGKDAQHNGEPFKMEKLEDMLHEYDKGPLVMKWFLYPMRYSVESMIEGAKSELRPPNP